MKKERAYDLPTRLLHWLFAGLFLSAFAIARLIDDESPWFAGHMLLGILLGAVSLLRVLWGFTGSRTARFRSFPLRPALLLRYLRELFGSQGARSFGHNPASAWAAIGMIAAALGLGATGALMASGQKESFEDLHELLANAFAFLAAAHVAGVILHSLRHRDGIALSMIHGNKENQNGEAPLESSRPLVALGMAGLLGLFALQLCRNYDSSRGSLSLFGARLQLGEKEAPDPKGAAEETHESDDD